MNTRYLRFTCKTCGEVVDTQATDDEKAVIAEARMELTCLSAHSDIYLPGDVTVLEAKPAADKRLVARAIAAGG